MRLYNNRKAFSMLTAIVVIVLMASVGAFVMNLSGKMLKTTTTQFQREQAALLAKSYTEYAIMAVMSNDVATNCLKTITSNNALGNYNIRTEIFYIGNNARVGNCTDATDPTKNRILSNGVVTTNSPINIIVDVYVTYPDFDNPNNNARMTYHKRTLQKI